MNQLYTDGTDRWLTPPDLLEKLGEFDLDPCCEAWMPWRTAKRMLALAPTIDSIVPGHSRFTDQFVASEIVANGLQEKWEGRVFMNHPYSCGLPWAEKFVAHHNGIALTASKSLDTRWGQIFLNNCDAVLFPAGRFLFHYPDGTKSIGKWLPNALWAFGESEAQLLLSLWETSAIPGRVLRPWP